MYRNNYLKAKYADTITLYGGSNASGANPKVELTSSQFKMTDSVGTQRLLLDSTSGAIIGNPSKGRVQITDAGMFVYDTNSKKRTQVDANGLHVYNTDGSTEIALFGITTGNSSPTARIGTTTGPAFHINDSSLQAYYMNNGTRTMYFEVTPTKMTYGSFTAASTEAVEELNSELVDQFEVLDDSLSTLQDNIYGYEDDQEQHVDGIVDELNADIANLNSGLNEKVNADEIIDAVNKSPEEASIRISGARLDIETNASFRGLTEIANAKIDTAQATALFAQMLAAGRIRVGDMTNIHIEQYPSRLSFLQAGKTLEGYNDSQIAQQGAVPFEGEVAFVTVDANGDSVFYMNRSVVVNDLRFGN